MDTVLLVDDDHGLRRLMTEWMIPDRVGFALVTACDGLDALRKLDEHDVGLVVTDIHMPRLDGIGLLAAMMERHPNVPAIVLSVEDPEQLGPRVKGTGALRCLEKSLDPLVLSTHIANALRQRQFGGSVTGVSLFGFVQLLGMERKSCVVEVPIFTGLAP